MKQREYRAVAAASTWITFGLEPALRARRSVRTGGRAPVLHRHRQTWTMTCPRCPPTRYLTWKLRRRSSGMLDPALCLPHAFPRHIFIAASNSAGADDGTFEAHPPAQYALPPPSWTTLRRSRSPGKTVSGITWACDRARHADEAPSSGRFAASPIRSGRSRSAPAAGVNGHRAGSRLRPGRRRQKAA